MVYAMVASGDPAWFTMDCIIHALAIAEIAVGLHAALQYGKLPPEDPEGAKTASPLNEENEPPEDSEEP